MGRTHKELQVLATEVKDAKTKVTGLGFLEANDELCVIYQAQYGERITFLRPLSIWLEQVEWEGRTVPRFTKI